LLEIKLEIAAQGVAQCKVSATHVVVDAALRRIGYSVIFVNENENENEKDQQFVHENEN